MFHYVLWKYKELYQYMSQKYTPTKYDNGLKSFSNIKTFTSQGVRDH